MKKHLCRALLALTLALAVTGNHPSHRLGR